MSRFLIVVLTLMMAIPVFAQDGSDVAITVYNQGLGLVREIRSLELERGIQAYAYDGVAGQMVPTSVRFNASGIDILEQNFEYDLVNNEALMKKYLGQTIDVVLKDEVITGRLLSTQGGIIVQEDGGGVRMIRTNVIQTYRFPELPDGLMIRPSLRWLLNSERSGNVDAELAYLTRGLDWEANYIAVVNEDDDGLELSGWVQMTNESGTDYLDAKLKLMAGDVQFMTGRPQAPGRGYADAMYAMDEASKGFEEKSFFEYHLYTLPRRVDILDKQVKQIRLIEPADTDVEKKYIYSPMNGNDVHVKLEFTNSEAEGLGMPLPAGLVRMYKIDPDDNTMQLIGEDRIDHTPRDEDVSLKTGNSFDVVAERRRMNTDRIGPTTRQDDYEVELRNRKDEDIEVIVREHFGGDWTIMMESLAGTKIDANRYEWIVPVKAGEEVTLTYKVRYQ
jgi:hypothetical protein